MFLACEDSSSTRRLERPTRRKLMATSAGRSPRFRVPHNRPSATRMGVIPIIRESSHSLEKKALRSLDSGLPLQCPSPKTDATSPPQVILPCQRLAETGVLQRCL